MSKIAGVIELIEAGLKAEGLRQKAIANNIANLETPGYRRIDVKFTELLAKVKSGGTVKAEDMEPQLYHPKQTPVKSNGNDVTLEVEIGEMVKNSLRYKTYIGLLSKKYRHIEMAMKTER